MASSLGMVAYLALFATVGFTFVFVNLLIGRFLRPHNPHPEKQEIYECGEPTIGSSFVQFDLRFYVVALIFIIFDVEVAFMFPWATVYGKATHLAQVGDQAGQLQIVTDEGGKAGLTPGGQALFTELGVAAPETTTVSEISTQARRLVNLSIYTMAIFFFVLFLGFAYEWKTGAIDWVRAISKSGGPQSARPPTVVDRAEEPVLSA